MRKDILEKKDEILQMINEKEPKSRICKILKCKPETLEGYLTKMNIVYKGNPGLKGKKNNLKRKTAEEYLQKDLIVTSKLRKKLIEDNIKKNECELCGISEWRNQKLTLELHHMDGNKFNNNLNNLQILCPNCHSLTPNHSHHKQEKKFINRKKNFCKCGKEIGLRSKLCFECYSMGERKVSNRPNIKELIELVKINGYKKTGKMFNVSDNAIRKWIKNAPVAQLD